MEAIQIFLIASLILNVVILVVLFVFYSSQKRVLDISPFIRKISELREDVTSKEKEVLEEAVGESKASVEGTLEDLRGTERLSEETKLKLEREAEELVRESISKHSEIFQNMMNSISDSYKKGFENMNNLQREEYAKVLGSAKASVQEEVSRLRAEVSKASEEERMKVAEELKSYKNKLKADLDQRIFSIIADVARDTIGESIDTAKHEDLVMQSLNKAKNEKFM